MAKWSVTRVPEIDEATMLSNILSWLVLEANQQSLKIFGKQDMAHWEHGGRRIRVFVFRESPVTRPRIQITIGKDPVYVDTVDEAIEKLKQAMGLADAVQLDGSRGADTRQTNGKPKADRVPRRTHDRV